MTINLIKSLVFYICVHVYTVRLLDQFIFVIGCHAEMMNIGARLSMYLGFIGPGACLVGTGFIECNKIAAVSMIVIAVGLSGISMAGWAVNHLDLAPPYAGIPLFIVPY